MRLASLSTLATLSLALSACATTNDRTTADLPAEAPGPVDVIEKSGDESEIDAVIASVDQRVETEPDNPTETEVGDEITHAKTGEIPIELNDSVERWIEYFTVKDTERFQRFIERGEKYRPMITAVLKEQGIPTEIYYQAMIESGFATAATSHASAVGVWQFIKDTGRRYGLRVDSYVDERRDPMRATIAASLYLKDLYNVFQSWYLAMAAYNAGETRIMGAIMRAKTRDFWEMVRGKALPAVTMDYIPKFLAATIIGHNPRRYGMNDITPQTMPMLASVTVPSPIRLEDVAKVTGVSLAVLKDANPHILRGVTPPGDATYRLWVPKDDIEAFIDQEDNLAALRLRGLKAVVAAAPAHVPKIHRVQRGETLASIAAKYGTSVAALKKLNRLSSTNLLAGQRLKVQGTKVASATSRQYKVKRGDNLDQIAKRFGLSTVELKKLNRLKRNTIFVGQVLKVNGGSKG
jgi:membrane-bound lytic murein transglycosylase D